MGGENKAAVTVSTKSQRSTLILRGGELEVVVVGDLLAGQDDRS
jgi:hypothetical protein